MYKSMATLRAAELSLILNCIKYSSAFLWTSFPTTTFIDCTTITNFRTLWKALLYNLLVCLYQPIQARFGMVKIRSLLIQNNLDDFLHNFWTISQVSLVNFHIHCRQDNQKKHSSSAAEDRKLPARIKLFTPYLVSQNFIETLDTLL